MDTGTGTGGGTGLWGFELALNRLLGPGTGVDVRAGIQRWARRSAARSVVSPESGAQINAKADITVRLYLLRLRSKAYLTRHGG